MGLRDNVAVSTLFGPSSWIRAFVGYYDDDDDDDFRPRLLLVFVLQGGQVFFYEASRVGTSVPKSRENTYLGRTRPTQERFVGPIPAVQCMTQPTVVNEEVERKITLEPLLASYVVQTRA